MSIFIDSIDNDNSESQAVVVVGYAQPNDESGQFLSACIAYGGAASRPDTPLEISSTQIPSNPILYVATTTSIGYFYLDGNIATYPYSKLGQDIPDGVWTQVIVDGATYELEIKDGGIIGLSQH